MRGKRGITLIALVITIIVLIILAGVSIQLLLGENGIITKAKKGKGDYEESAVREKVELALADYNSDKLTKGEEGEIEEALNRLLDNNTFEDIEIEESIGIIGDYEITLGKEKQEVVIDGIDKVTGTLRLRCKLSTKEYTKDSITIHVKASGNVGKLIKPDNTEETPIDGKIEIDYFVNENGNYMFKLEDVEGNQIEKTVVVKNIDTLLPKEFTIEANPITENGFTIIANAQDAEATETSACSGIDRYEYFVKKVEDTDYPDTPNTRNEITGLSKGRYQVYAVAYDKAGNSKASDPIEVAITVKFDLIASGSSHILAVDVDGNLWTWGSNSNGELGTGSYDNEASPVQILEGVKFKHDSNIDSIAAGPGFSLAIDEDGYLWSWGLNSNGQLGHGNKTNSPVPVKLEEYTFSTVSAGRVCSLAIDTEGYIWGSGYSVKSNSDTILVFTKLNDSIKFKSISAGGNHCLAIADDGSVYGLGTQYRGSLGNGVTASLWTALKKVMSGMKAKKVSAGLGHSLIIAEDGKLYGCGSSDANTNYQALPGSKDSAVPVLIGGNDTYIDITAGDRSSFAIKSDGTLWSAGLNKYGTLGIGTTSNTKVWTRVNESKTFSKVYAGAKVTENFSLVTAIDSNKNTWYWGNGQTTPIPWF